MTTGELFPEAPGEPRVLTVRQLTAQIKELVEASFPSVWVSGEISNLARPSSGHYYLTLKDDRSQLRAVIWRGTARWIRFQLGDGMEVVCRGHLDVYARRGSYQLIIERIEPKGIGALELALRQLRDKLAAEGLFDPARKRPLPRFIERVAVVTSPTGAAIRDFLQVLARRWPGTEVLLIPTRVQGAGAAAEVAAAVRTANRLRTPIDCLVVTRGGGSLEDLWSFNDEMVVRAIRASRIPVVSAVGHEVDVTLSDLAADVRALTPSEAAERVVPASEELEATLGQYRRRLVTALRNRAAAARSRLEGLARHHAFRRPYQRVQELARRVDELEARAGRAARHRLRHARERTDAVAARLESLSPLAVLARGYSLTQRTSDGQLIRRAADVEPGEQITTRLAEGKTVSRVEVIERE